MLGIRPSKGRKDAPVLTTLHRQENVDHAIRLVSIVKGIGLACEGLGLRAILADASEDTSKAEIPWDRS